MFKKYKTIVRNKQNQSARHMTWNAGSGLVGVLLHAFQRHPSSVLSTPPCIKFVIQDLYSLTKPLSFDGCIYWSLNFWVSRNTQKEEWI